MAAPEIVHQNARCHVIAKPGGGYRVVRTADGHRIADLEGTDAGKAQAIQFAEQVAGPVSKRPPMPPVEAPPSGVHPDAGIAGPHPRGASS